jgi:hypothetical protein
LIRDHHEGYIGWDDIRDGKAIRLEALAQSIEVRQLAGIESGFDRLGGFGLAGAVRGERQQAHRGAEGVLLALLGE